MAGEVDLTIKISDKITGIIIGGVNESTRLDVHTIGWEQGFEHKNINVMRQRPSGMTKSPILRCTGV